MKEVAASFLVHVSSDKIHGKKGESHLKSHHMGSAYSCPNETLKLLKATVAC